MNLFDRLRLLIHSTVNGALRGNLPEMPDANSSERSDKLIDKAQARVEMLQGDLARAEKRGDAELANRLKRDINELQTSLDKARRKADQASGAPATSQAATTPRLQTSSQPEPQEASTTTQQTTEQTTQQSAGKQQEVNGAPGVQADEELDGSRVADQIRKMREGK